MKEEPVWTVLAGGSGGVTSTWLLPVKNPGVFHQVLKTMDVEHLGDVDSG